MKTLTKVLIPILFSPLICKSSENDDFNEFASALFMSTCFQQMKSENASKELLNIMGAISLGKNIELRDGVKANVYAIKRFENRFDVIFDDIGNCTVMVYKSEKFKPQEKYFFDYMNDWLKEKNYEYKSLPHKPSDFAVTKEFQIIRPEGEVNIMYSFPKDLNSKRVAIFTAF